MKKEPQSLHIGTPVSICQIPMCLETLLRAGGPTQQTLPRSRGPGLAWLLVESPPGTLGRRHVSGPGKEAELGPSQPKVLARHFLLLVEEELEPVTDHRPSSASGPSTFTHIITIPIL